MEQQQLFGRKDRETNMEITKPYVVVEKGDNLLNCALFNTFFCVQKLNTNKNTKYKLPARGRKVLDIRSPES
jgi:hypothetical protein